MSNLIRSYIGANYTGMLYVTAFHGGKQGRSVQFTINDCYCQLAENQVRDLIRALNNRLAGKDGYRSTDDSAQDWNKESVPPEEAEDEENAQVGA
jgi:hypothetical protein